MVPPGKRGTGKKGDSDLFERGTATLFYPFLNKKFDLILNFVGIRAGAEKVGGAIYVCDINGGVPLLEEPVSLF